MDFIEANGAGLRCELSGGGDRTLVLVHEMGGSLESWDDVAPRFAKSRRVLRYDTRGAGLSQKVRGELTLDTMADDIAALLDHFGIAGKVALAGDRRRRRHRSAFCGPLSGAHQRRRGRQPGHRASPRSAARRRWSARADRSRRHGVRGRGFDAERLCAGAARRHQAVRAFRTRWLGNDPSSYATIWRMLAAADMQDELARLACPVLVIGGSLDRVRPPALAEGAAKAIPGARYVEIRTGHYMSVQTPDLLSDTIDEFLKSVGA